MISSVYPHKKVSCCPHIPNSNPKFHFWTSVFLHFFLLFFTSLPRQEVLATTLLIVGAGVRPRQELAESCGLELGGRGGIKVRMGHQGGWARGGAGFGALLMFCFCFSPFNPLFFWEACCVLMLEIFGTLGEIEWVTVTWVHRGFLGSCLVIEATDMGILRWFLLQHAWNGYSHYRSGLQTISHGYSSLVTIARMSLFQCCEWVKLRWFHPP